MAKDKIRTRPCARCGRQQRTGNGYCKECNAIRMAESRGKVPQPETEEDKETRDIVDKTFNLLESVPGAEVTVKGINMKSNDDGTVTFNLNNRQQKRLAERVKRLDNGVQQ